MKDHDPFSAPPDLDLVGRLAELKILKDCFASRKAEFIALYGRRRVGKTYLVKYLLGSLAGPSLHMTGSQNDPAKEQLKEFAKQIGEAFYRGAPITPRKNWKDAFEDLHQAIKTLPGSQPIVLFLDEFPWMATPRSKLLNALELYWNRYWAFDKRIKLIICGSATSWIIENIINNKGGLHNRVTRTINLRPFSLEESACLLQSHGISLNHKQIIDLYIALGGVPLYWTYVTKGLSAHQCINDVCFHQQGPLVNEFPRLFKSLFEDAEPYERLIRTIANRRYGIGQAQLIAEAKLPNGGRTIKRLTELEEAGFIASFIPYGHKNRGIYYVIDDEYCLFYLRWIEPHLHTINKKSRKDNFWTTLSQQPAYRSWAGMAFETVCYKHVDQIRIALGLDSGAIPGTWRYSPKPGSSSSGVQIDLLFDRPDGTITICEVKHSESPFNIDKSYAQNLAMKLKVFQQQTRTKKQLFLAMITANGLKPNMYSEEMVSNTVSAESLFRSL